MAIYKERTATWFLLERPLEFIQMWKSLRSLLWFYVPLLFRSFGRLYFSFFILVACTLARDWGLCCWIAEYLRSNYAWGLKTIPSLSANYLRNSIVSEFPSGSRLFALRRLIARMQWQVNKIIQPNCFREATRSCITLFVGDWWCFADVFTIRIRISIHTNWGSERLRCIISHLSRKLLGTEG